MPRRAVPARVMSNACSKNFAAASGSGTMMAMWRSLAMAAPFWQRLGIRSIEPKHRPARKWPAIPTCVARRADAHASAGPAPAGTSIPQVERLELADCRTEGALEHAAALLGLFAHMLVALARNVAQIPNGGIDGGNDVDVHCGAQGCGSFLERNHV